MLAVIEEKKCVGCGLCANVVPDLFEVKDKKAIVIIDMIPSELEEIAQEAKDSCPVEAIMIS
ncbi:MAG: ferredoxin [Candidatus Omnitrophica bacterium]|nr:ferredoxin [Candidatus Omnitrophota bacterium]